MNKLNEIRNKKPIIVYCNKSHDVWMMDAYRWMKNNNIKETDVKEVISEVVFNWRITDKETKNEIVIFITDIYTKH